MNPDGRRWFLDSYWTAAGSRGAGLHTGYTFGYDAHGRVASVTAPQVTVTEQGVGTGVTMRPVVKTRSLQMAILGTGWLGNEVTRVRPENIRVELTDARNNTTRMAVDPLGNATRLEEPLNRSSSTTTDRHGRVMRSVSPAGNATLAEYVGVELRKSINEGTGAVVQMEYEDKYHQLTHAWGSGTTEVWNTYDLNDPARKLLSSQRGTSRSPKTFYTYTTRDRVSAVKDGKGHGTFYKYGDEVAGVSSDNVHTISTGTASETYRRTTTRIYDQFGRDSMTISPGKDTTRTAYDLLNRVLKFTDADGRATDYEYRSGQLYQVRDARGQYYAFHRDLLGRLGSDVDPRGKYRYYGYDRAGNLTSRTNRRGQTVTTGYDALNARVSLSSTDGVSATRSYDPSGRWVQVSNAASTDRMEYDAAGRLSGATTTRGGTNYTQVPAYNSDGQRTQLDVYGPWSGAHAVKYGYRPDARLGSITDFSGSVTTLDYDEDGALKSAHLGTWPLLRSVGNSLHSPNIRNDWAYNYTAQGRVHERSNLHSVEPLFDRYYYDPAGQLTGVDRFRDTESDSGSCRTDEDGNQVCTGITHPQLLSSVGYGYDEVGNRNDRNAVVTPGNRVTDMDGYKFVYDDDGNVTRKYKEDGTFEQGMTWNSLGQMTSLTVNGSIMEYRYDAFGRWVNRTRTGVMSHEYVYDGNHLLLERDQAGALSEYTYYPGVDQPHSVRQGTTTYYYAQDHPGNVTSLWRSDGTLVNEYRYSPWGERIAGTNETVGNSLQFAARHYEPLAGIYQVRARWYDPQLGRFLSEDPIGLAGGINPYVYAANSPTNLRDPSGLDPTIEECEKEIKEEGGSDEFAARGCGRKGGNGFPLAPLVVPGNPGMVIPPPEPTLPATLGPGWRGPRHARYAAWRGQRYMITEDGRCSEESAFYARSKQHAAHCRGVFSRDKALVSPWDACFARQYNRSSIGRATVTGVLGAGVAALATIASGGTVTLGALGIGVVTGVASEQTEAIGWAAYDCGG